MVFSPKNDNLRIYKDLINGRKDLRLIVSKFVVCLGSAWTGIQNRKGLSFEISVFLSLITLEFDQLNDMFLK